MHSTEEYSYPGSNCRAFLTIQPALLEGLRGIEIVSAVVKNRAAAYSAMAARKTRDTTRRSFQAGDFNLDMPGVAGGLAAVLVLGLGLFRFIQRIFHAGSVDVQVKNVGAKQQ